MRSMTHFDQQTVANMTAALAYVCRKLPPNRDTSTLRRHIAEEIMTAAKTGKTTLGELTAVGLNLVNEIAFPPGRRSWG